MVRYEIDSDNSDQCYLIDQNGNKLEGKYFWEYGTFDDILLVRKYQENDNSYGKNYTMLVKLSLMNRIIRRNLLENATRQLPTSTKLANSFRMR